MLYRIDYEHFITHAIDHFTRDELKNFQYAIISAGMINGGRTTNIIKLNELYPNSETQELWRETEDKKLLKKAYIDYFESEDFAPLVYQSFINPILQHNDIVIICMRNENVYIDIIVEYLKKKFLIDCIDLNKLFMEGRVGNIYINWKEIHNKAVDIRIIAGKIRAKDLARTSDGRLKLLAMMKKSDKIKKLNELGITINKSDEKNLDKLLTSEWVEDIDIE